METIKNFDIVTIHTNHNFVKPHLTLILFSPSNLFSSLIQKQKQKRKKPLQKHYKNTLFTTAMTRSLVTLHQ